MTAVSQIVRRFTMVPHTRTLDVCLNTSIVSTTNTIKRMTQQVVTVLPLAQATVVICSGRNWQKDSKALQIPLQLSDYRVALKWPLVAARILTRKLNLLSKVSSGGESIGCHMYTFLAVANPQSLRLIQECLSLENKLDCHGVTDLV